LLCIVYGKKPTQKQKDNREQLLATGNPVEKMAERRMVRHCPSPKPMTHEPCRAVHDNHWWVHEAGMLKMIPNIAFAHRSQHVQFGRFNTEDEVCALRQLWMLECSTRPERAANC
jgi:hypothetical protein